MKKSLYLSLCLASILLLGTACKKYDDMPPLPESNQTNRLYKLKDPRPMTPEEQDKDKQVREEYNRNTN